MDVLHSRQLILNPMQDEKLTRFCKMLDLPKGGRVVDIGCGKGEFVHKLHEMYGVSGVGVDKSHYFIEECRRQKALKVPDADIEYLLMDGKDYVTNEVFDLASCIGASWIWGGIKGTLEALSNLTKPGGFVVLGEPYWLKEPSELRD